MVASEDPLPELRRATQRAGRWLVRTREAGSGTPLVCLPGSGDTGGAWKPLYDRLADRCALRALDLDRSEGPRDGEAGGLADDLELLSSYLRTLSEPVHLVGHSYGGLLALRFALAHPGRVRSLCLVEPIAFGVLRDASGEQETERRLVHVLESFFRTWESRDHSAALEIIVDYWNGSGAWAALTSERRQRLLAGAERFRSQVASAHADRTSLEEVRSLAIPTLVVFGENTTAEEERVCELLAASIPGAGRLRVADAGHSPMRSHAEAVAAGLRGLLTVSDG